MFARACDLATPERSPAHDAAATLLLSVNVEVAGPVAALDDDAARGIAVASVYEHVRQRLFAPDASAWCALSAAGLRDVAADSAYASGSSAHFPLGACFVFASSIADLAAVSSPCSTAAPSGEATSAGYPGVAVAVSTVRCAATGRTPTRVTALCAVSFVPLLLRRAPLTLGDLPVGVAALVARGDFVALSSAAAAAGIGSWSPGTCAAEDGATATATFALPALQPVRVLAVGRCFPSVDVAAQTVRRWPSGASEAGRDAAAAAHLAELRRAAASVVRRERGVAALAAVADGADEVPQWMLPSAASAVDAWVAVSFPAGCPSGDSDDDEDGVGSRHSAARCILPLCALWGFVDVRAHVCRIPPAARGHVASVVSSAVAAVAAASDASEAAVGAIALKVPSALRGGSAFTAVARITCFTGVGGDDSSGACASPASVVFATASSAALADENARLAAACPEAAEVHAAIAVPLERNPMPAPAAAAADAPPKPRPKAGARRARGA
jgi:hypothetical protein